MPRDYWGEAKIKFPLPSYPKEDAFEDSAKYEASVDGFGLDRQRVLAEHSTWVDRETIATHARAADERVARAGMKGAIPRESIEVAREANELWRANLELRERRLAMAEKQAARDECLIGAVQALTAALSRTDLVADSAQGRVVGGMGKGRSTGKGKGRAYPELSAEESDDEDAEGEGEGSGGGDD